VKEDVLKHIKECMVCQQSKNEKNFLLGLLQLLPIPKQKWESVSMDFITWLPKVQGKDCIYVVVDRLTNYAHLFPITYYFKASQVAELFWKEIFRLHGLPGNIASD
jgi:hypothetical protein